MFEDQLTGIEVYRTIENGSYADDDSVTTNQTVLVLKGFRQIDPSGSGQAQVVSEYGTQTAQNYLVYFELTDNIQKSDIIKFNSSKINSNQKYIPSKTDDTVLRIANFVDGSGDLGMREAECISF